MMTKCKHLVRDPSWRKPPHCIKLKVDEPGRLGLCRKCMFREAESEVKEEPETADKNAEALERANEVRKSRWREYLAFKGPDWRPLLKAAMEAEREYIDLASKAKGG